MKCDDTLTADTVAVTTGGLALYGRESQGGVRKQKRIYFCKLVAILHMSSKLRWRQWEYRHMGCNAMSQKASEFLAAHSTQKKTPPLLALNAVTSLSEN